MMTAARPSFNSYGFGLFGSWQLGPWKLTQFEVWTGFRALEGVQDEDAYFEKVAVGSDIQPAHLVKAITVHQERDESDSSPKDLDVMNNAIDGWCRNRNLSSFKGIQDY